MSVGIVGYGIYIPKYRLKREEITLAVLELVCW